MTKPLIGITAATLPHMFDEEDLTIDYIPENYARAIRLAGGLPVLLPIAEPELAVQYMTSIDGLLLAGGADIEPHHYNETPVPELGKTLPSRDCFEFALFAAAKQQGKPIFGICRGLQLINVALGGSLYQDLPSQYSANQLPHSQTPPLTKPVHPIQIAPDSHLAHLLGETVAVNSFHHQAIKALAPELSPVAFSEDGLIEAVEGDKLLAVQWHPEELLESSSDMLTLFTDFIKRCQQTN